MTTLLSRAMAAAVSTAGHFPSHAGRFFGPRHQIAKYTSFDPLNIQKDSCFTFRAAKADDCFRAALELNPCRTDADTLYSLFVLVRTDLEARLSDESRPFESDYKVRGITFNFFQMPGSQSSQYVLRIQGMHLPKPMLPSMTVRG